MRVIYLTLVFLFARKFRNVHSPNPGSGNPDLRRSPSSNFSPQSPSGSSSNPCDEKNIRFRASDALSTCQNECLTLTAEISIIYNAFPDYKTTKYLHDTCGMVTEGKCSTATYSPICWCHTPKASEDQRTVTLFNCRSGIEIVRKFINATTITASDNVANSGKKRINGQEMSQEAAVEAVAMYQLPPPRFPTGRPRTPRSRPGTRPVTRFGTGGFETRPSSSSAGPSSSSAGPSRSSAGPSSSSAGPFMPPPSSPPEREEYDFNSRPDGQPEGDLLWTDVRVKGHDVRAKLDTGSPFNIIHPKFADHMVPIDTSGAFVSGSYQAVKISGTTTINLEIRKGITIPLAGFVTDRHHLQILLGADFFADYAAKIKILERKMEIRTRQTIVPMTLRFRDAPARVDMIDSRFPSYMSLQISANVNGKDTRMDIDTGASITVVSKNFVSKKSLRPASLKCSYGGGQPVGFKGKTDINLIIASNRFNVPAFVPKFVPPFDLLTGNDFNKLYVELIDYELKSVTLRLPRSSGYVQIAIQAFIIKGQ